MKTIWSIIIVLIAVVLIYLAYKYIFAKKSSLNTNVTNPITNLIDAVVPKNPCDSLADKKSSIDSLYAIANKLFSDYSDTVAGNYSQEKIDIAANLFKSAEYNYKNAIIEYNGVYDANACVNSTVVEIQPFVYKGQSFLQTETGGGINTVGAGTGTGNQTPLNCNFTERKLQIDIAQSLTNNAYLAFQMANGPSAAQKYQMYSNYYADYSKQIDEYNTLAQKCFEQKGIQTNFLTKMNFYNP